MKLWLAGSARNWDLAAFELKQLTGQPGRGRQVLSRCSFNGNRQTSGADEIDFRCDRREGQAGVFQGSRALNGGLQCLPSIDGTSLYRNPNTTSGPPIRQSTNSAKPTRPRKSGRSTANYCRLFSTEAAITGLA
jgi:hypothetical protein